MKVFKTWIESCGPAKFVEPRREQPTCHHSIPVLPPCAANVKSYHLEFCGQYYILWHVAFTQNTDSQQSKFLRVYYSHNTRTKYTVQKRVDTDRQLAGLPLPARQVWKRSGLEMC